MSNRREFLEKVPHSCAAVLGLGVAAAANEAQAEQISSGQRFLLVGLCGSENPTRANFPFVWATALEQAGNKVRIELAGDATVLMRTVVADNVLPVGWPPFKEALAKVIELKIPIFV